MLPFTFPTNENSFLVEHVTILEQNHRALLGESLIPGIDDMVELARQLFNSEFVILSHDTSAPPVFNYANMAGLSLFEMSWSEMTALPSKYSAEPDAREARERFLSRVAEQGYIDDYCGVRVSGSGRRFMITRAVVWNLEDTSGRYMGQAARFQDWRYL